MREEIAETVAALNDMFRQLNETIGKEQETQKESKITQDALDKAGKTAEGAVGMFDAARDAANAAKEAAEAAKRAIEALNNTPKPETYYYIPGGAPSSLGINGTSGTQNNVTHNGKMWQGATGGMTAA